MESLSPTPTMQTDGGSKQSQATADPQELQSLNMYLCSISFTLLDVDRDYFYKTIHESANQATISTFLTDHQYKILLVSKSRETEPTEIDPTTKTGGNSENPHVSFHLEVLPADVHAHTIAFIKRSNFTDQQATKKKMDGGSQMTSGLLSYTSRLQVINIGYAGHEFSPYELTHNYVQNCFTPLFNTVKTINDSSKSVGTDKQNFQLLQKKLSELSLALIRCQQGLEVPEIRLNFDPDVRAKVQEARAQNRTPVVEDFGALLDDANFIENLVRCVQKWTVDISTVTKMKYDLTTGSVLQEINYWISFERSLNLIDEQLKLPEVKLTIDILHAKKKYSTTIAFENDLDFKKVLNTCIACNSIMREFPINDLMSAITLADISSAINSIFIHLKKIVAVESYPTPRCLQLVEAVSRDLNAQLLKILGSVKIMQCQFKELANIIDNARTIFNKWDTDYLTYRNNLKTSRSDGRSLGLCSLEHVNLSERLSKIFQFRKEHEQLREVIEGILTKESRGRGEVNFLTTKDINEAYAIFLGIDVLDTSKEGEQSWNAAKKAYDLKIDKVESQITTKLRDQLAEAETAGEMFRIFGKFNALFFRPHIKGAIQEYQVRLLQIVQKDIQALKDKFLKKYSNTDAAKISQVRDIPANSGQVIWAKQLNRRLRVYMERVESILGPDWYEQPEGRELKEIGQQFESHLNVQKFCDAYIEEIKSGATEIQPKEKIFNIVQKKRSNQLELVVNFDEKIINLFKEVRNLNWLKVKLPYTITFKAEEAQGLYPYAVSLQESLRTFNLVNSKIDDRIAKLVATYRKEVQVTIEQGIQLNWNLKVQLESYVKKLADKVNSFEEAVNNLNEKVEQIYAILASMNNCGLESGVLLEKLEAIQKIIDDFNFKQYSNLHQWVPELDVKIEAVLTKRLIEAIQNWVKEFESGKPENRALIIETLVHEVKIQDQTIYVDPPIEYSRYFWMQQFHKQVGLICSLSRIEASRYEYFKEAGKESGPKKDSDYHALLKKIPQDVLYGAYDRISTIVSAAEEYVRTWTNYQALWEIDIKKVYDRLGDNIELWQKLLEEIKEGRKTFDNSETEKAFGSSIVVDYRMVQVKINNKYDAWHKEILNQFGATFNENLKTFFSNISVARKKLEKMNFQGVSSSEITQAITEMQEIKKSMSQWTGDMEKFRNGQKLLDRQRYHPPSDWLYIDQVEGEWSAVKQLVSRKGQQMENELPTIQAQILSDEQIQNEKIKEIEELWRNQRPNSGDVLPHKALDILNIIDGQVQRVKESYTRICKAKELLGLEPGNLARLEVLEEEVGGLKNVWTELNRVWAGIEALKETPLSGVVAKKLKSTLEEAIEQLNALPNRLRQYEAFEAMKDRLQRFKKMNLIILELKSDAVKPRHWKKLLDKLKITVSFTELNIGHLWASDLIRNENAIKDILTVATGEYVLEKMLRDIKEYWNAFELELARYQNKCKLIRGWDELFAKMDDDMNNLSSMKISPYYKAFEEEILPWDDKLQKMRIIFDIWIDVQRRWVYLEGIFFGASDIKEQLSNEYTRFKGIDNEFTSLMKKVAAKPNILDVISQPGLQKTLERLADLLAKIQKALGEYLETQRSAFARFYFVGDEDLLEIIGNSKDVKNVQRHFNKMFAGISTLSNEEEGDLITGMNSREGESVKFSKSVKISEDPKINVWLSKVEDQMQLSIADNLQSAIKEISVLSETKDKSKEQEKLNQIELYPAQVVVLSMQVIWSTKVEQALETGAAGLQEVVSYIIDYLSLLAERVLTDLPKEIRQKYEQLITDFVHQRDVARLLIVQGANSPKDFAWAYHMRFYWYPKEPSPLKKLSIQMSSARFNYGFEYLGVGEKLVQTPLTDKCYLTLTQALHMRMGGNPFGPAGTGKTESVKALGSQLGFFVLVFNCDETFDFQAMGRIFVGLCQVGAWGCFDEFNRLEERMLSAVSQQILTIQTGLREKSSKIHLMAKDVKLNQQMGIFVTMNPGYAGRSNLPENLKQLFRQMAMVKPDRELIAQVMLYSQGYRSAERLAGKIVSLFELCNDQLSSQPHYDFGLRALKAVLNSAGNLRRGEKPVEFTSEDEMAEWEQKILLRSVCDTIVPKLIAEDIPLLSTLLTGVFPGSQINPIKEDRLREEIKQLCIKRNLLCQDSFMEKVLQLYQIQKLVHGVMMVGPSGCGKSAAWRILLEAMYKVDKIKGEFYIVDPKAISKDDLYGKLDSTTLEWTDGVFTHILRNITANVRGESSKRHWIIFDGDVDPEWAENLNSVLDDNKLLTLPNGERINIPPNVRIMFEVESLKYATLATVSRCGMVWFSEEVVSLPMIFHHYLNRLKEDDYDDNWKNMFEGDNEADTKKSSEGMAKREQSQESMTRERCVAVIKKLFEGESSFAVNAIMAADGMKHVMEFTLIRVIEATFALIRKGVTNVLEYNESHSESPMDDSLLERYMRRWVLIAFAWGVGGSLNLQRRGEYCAKIQSLNTEVTLPNFQPGTSLLEYGVSTDDAEWYLWKKRVPTGEIDPQRVTDADLIITTVDTVRHQEILCSWLSEHRPFILCGPPGSGKTMTLMSTLKALPDFEMVFVNFSSSTSPGLLIKTFDQYCEYKKTSNGVILSPKQPNKWLIVFCDEINLPEIDKYGTIPVITFLRQLTEHHGFWRNSDKQWVSLERIQFVGACNPPTDSGRSPLSQRFLRHAPLILVDFPGPDSLRQIYGTFNRAMLRKVPTLKQHADSLTEAMVDFYTRSQNHFTADMQPHYIYSPRELTRWKYAINEALEPLESLEDLVRLWAHEALRLFQDRLVHPEEKKWCEELVDEVAMKCFPNLQPNALERPILFTTYLSKNYQSVEREALRSFIQARLKVFYEEELNVPIVVFDSVLDHILRIDRVLRQPIGHVLLVGSSGVGKTTLSRFVSWMNNLSIFQIKAGRNYSLADFDRDLREVMMRSGCKQEKICFIFDESNVLSIAFMERMNALLASGEVPGLFEGEDYMALINQCKEASLRDNKMVDSEEQLYKNFIKNVQRNLHVVFTMNPSNPDFSNRTASSPALFNRCVIDWFGEWSQEGLFQVAKEFTLTVDAEASSFKKKDLKENAELRHTFMVNLIVQIHNSVVEINKRLAKSAKKFNYITPRDFLDFIKQFVRLHAEKKEELIEQQRHLGAGLNKLKETEEQVIKLQVELDKYKEELDKKEKLANEKLKLMVAEQNEAEKRREASIKLSQELDIKQGVIKERQAIVNQELEEAVPALEKAKNAVSGINPKDLNEMRKLLKPPELVKLTAEAVVSLLTGKVEKWDWKEVLAEMSKNTFMSSVLGFNSEKISAPLKKKLIDTYTAKPEWDIERIRRASQVAGPLADWVTSQIKYADILTKVQPLRDEVAGLKKEEEVLLNKAKETNQLIDDLQKNIDNYKREYAELITEKENIKNEMLKVQEKVERSKKLISNLSSERTRWEFSSKNFQQQLATMTGDTLISGAFLAYIGFFDHYYRKVLINYWRDLLENAGLLYRSDLFLTDYLPKPNERFLWQANRLPDDDLCTENAIILSKFNRYPLIIDPAGQAYEFLLSFYKDRKIMKTSFADDAFMKNLETALRFGTPLLVQDVEKIDPILNSVLNKELYKTGGRVLIRVGDQEIDFAPTFTMFMITRDSNARFTPDLCSRVTFVNFTVTPSSLEEQCLNIYLRNERPETDQKRIRLMKLQGEFKVKLRELEDQLLNALSNATGNILDNLEVIKTLQNLKDEASGVQREMEDSEKVLEEVKQDTEVYRPLAVATSKIFFAMGSMSQVYFLYHFSLAFFMDTVYSLLNENRKLTEISKSDYTTRLAFIYQELFRLIYQRVTHTLRNQDKMIFALRLAQIKLGSGAAACQDLLTQLIRGSSIIESKLSPKILGGKLSTNQLKLLEEVGNSQRFNDLVAHIESNEHEWLQLLKAVNVEDAIPKGWYNNEYESNLASTLNPHEKEIASSLRDLTIIKILRPDRFKQAAEKLIDKILGENFLDVPALNLGYVVEKESNPKSPLLLCSAPGFDASYKVDTLARDLNKKYEAVAIGSSEGFEQADRAIKQAAKVGSWVLLKNVHLAPAWLQELEKKVHGLQAHDNFRLFLSMEFNEKVPSTLIRQSYKFVFEPPDGIKASLKRSYQTVLSANRTDRGPAERSRLHFLLSWVHAVILERLRYTPIGWTKVYEFNEADQRCALDLVDELIDSFGERSNLSPDKIPWEAIRTILCQTLYGGKIDNDFDAKILSSLAEQFFTPKCFDHDFPLFDAANQSEMLTIPDVTKTSQFVEWINNLPAVESPAWSGLPVNVEKVLKEQQTEYLLSRIWQIQDANEEAVVLESVTETKKAVKKEGPQQLKWLRELGEKANLYIQILPTALEKLNRTSGSITNPLFRFLEREVTVASKLLSTLKTNLGDVKNLCEGKIQSTADLRKLALQLYADKVPDGWKKYRVANLSVSDWLTDFKKRLDQFNRIIPQKEYHRQGVWMGGLLFPEAYLTATRQAIAQDHQWSLEELELKVVIYQKEELDEDSFLVSGLFIEGAQWDADSKQLVLSEEMRFALPTLKFTWIRVNKADKGVVQDGEILVPVYLNRSRSNLLFSIKLQCGKIPRTTLYQKGIALIACEN